MFALPSAKEMTQSARLKTDREILTPGLCIRQCPPLLDEDRESNKHPRLCCAPPSGRQLAYPAFPGFGQMYLSMAHTV